MYSIAFPKMFSKNKTLVLEDHEAIKNNLYLLLKSDRTALFGDPYYGTELKAAIYEQNSQVIRDLVVDEIYTCIQIFMPQLLLTRNDVSVYSDGVDLFADVRCTYYLDQVSDLYTINMTENQIELYST